MLWAEQPCQARTSRAGRSGRWSGHQQVPAISPKPPSTGAAGHPLGAAQRASTPKDGQTRTYAGTKLDRLCLAHLCLSLQSRELASVSSITRPPTCTRTASELRLTACVPAGIVHLLPAALVAAHSSKRYRSAIATDLSPAPDFSSHTIRRLLAWCLGSARSDCALRPSSAKAITNAPETAAVGVSSRRPDPGVP